jgi:hypothetical protein
MLPWPGMGLLILTGGLAGPALGCCWAMNHANLTGNGVSLCCLCSVGKRAIAGQLLWQHSERSSTVLCLPSPAPLATPSAGSEAQEGAGGALQPPVRAPAGVCRALAALELPSRAAGGACQLAGSLVLQLMGSAAANELCRMSALVDGLQQGFRQVMQASIKEGSAAKDLLSFRHAANLQP